jgi:protein-tyrosine phosphatase
MSFSHSRSPAGGPALSRRRLLVAAGGLGLGALVAPGLMGSALADTSGVDPASRFIPIEGAFNVRDIGGYTTPTGRPVRWGKLIRSSSFNRITTVGQSQLSALAPRWVADFRSLGELAHSGVDRLPAEITGLSFPIGDDEQIDASLRVVAEAHLGAPPPVGPLPAANPWISVQFRKYVAMTEARTQFGAALRAVAASGDQKVVWHCNSGTYRTGWATAVLLTAIGVQKRDVYDDFKLSNLAFGGYFAFDEYLDAAFEQAHISFGSFDNYLYDGLGLDPATVTQLQNVLLG